RYTSYHVVGRETNLWFFGSIRRVAALNRDAWCVIRDSDVKSGFCAPKESSKSTVKSKRTISLSRITYHLSRLREEDSSMSSRSTNVISQIRASNSQKLEEKASGSAQATARLVSLDAFRGFIMFWIVGGGSLMVGLQALGHNRVIDTIIYHLNHTPWEG